MKRSARAAREAGAFLAIAVMLVAGSVAMLFLAQHAPQIIPWAVLISVPLFCWLSGMLADWSCAARHDLAPVPPIPPVEVPAAPLTQRYPSSFPTQIPPAPKPHVLFGAIRVRAGARISELVYEGPTLATCERVGICSCGASGPVYSGTYDVITVQPQPHVIAWHDQHVTAHRTVAAQ